MKVVDLYPLTPLQEGMLFHVLRDDVYLEQLIARLSSVDMDAFRAAWSEVVRVHPALRTAFAWQSGERPLQAVMDTVDVPFTMLDRIDVDAFLMADRKQGFALDRAPLMRLALIGLGDGSYRFVWTFHHLLLDGWSMRLVLADLERAYAGCELAVPRPFREFVEWSGRRAFPGEFWREELAGFAAPTPLPFGARAAMVGPSDTFRDVLPEGLAAALSRQARRLRVTIGSIVQSAWALLLARHGGVDDVLFGVTVSGRPAELAGVEQMVGLLANTLPVRVRVEFDARVGEWLQREHRHSSRLREFEHSPLVDVQRCSNIKAPVPLFESLFVFENYPGVGRQGIAGLQANDLRLEEHSNLPLTIAVIAAEPLRLGISYDVDVFDGNSVRRLAAQFVAVLEGLAGDPGRCVGAVSLLGAAERERLLVGVNATRVEYDDDPCLHELFEAQVDRAPGATAVECGGQRVSYADLDRRANRLARHLAGQGVGPETVVGVCLERSVELVVALLGVLKAGGCYLPIDPALPSERREFMLADAGAALLINRVDGTGGPGGRLRRRASASSAAYVIYTSGSTGRPKGVVVEHRCLVNLLRSEHVPGRIAQLTSIGFDVSLQEIFGALATGGTLVVFTRAEQLDLPALPALIETRGVNVVHLTPTVLHALDGPVKLDRVIAAGEELVVTEALLARLGEARLLNHYGPTETHVALTHAAERVTGTVPIGRPIANTRAYVLDAFLEPVPAGVVGELYLGGAGVARGYLGRPGLTAERFVPDPFGGGRLYRTGDLVRFRDGDVLEFVGRRDRQVKVRGHRVELGEIEASLAAEPGVGGALVMLRDERLVGYVTVADGGRIDMALLRDRLRLRLPEYMMPSALSVVERWPLTVNGKIDSAALPAPVAAQAAFVPPRTALERELAALWAQVLGIQAVGMRDNFFDLGGDSITAVRLLSRVKRRLAVDLSLRELIEAETLERLVQQVAARLRMAVDG